LVVAVADGLGGHAERVASSAAVHDLASGGSTLDSKEAVVKSLSDISEHITALANADRSRAGMATTIVGLAITPGHTFCFNVGDSPAFQLDGGYLTQVTTLDSPAQLAEDADDVAAPTAVVTQVLGPASTIDAHVRQRGHRCRHLLCSDGLSDLVPVAEMERLIADNAADDARAVRAMWAAAMNAGGSDNITIALVRRS
jgi:serine/threonine protein phosphatase PrpC